MPQFRYQGLSNNGESTSGVIAAPDRAAAIRMLLGRGETATTLVAESEAPASPAPVRAAAHGETQPAQPFSLSAMFSTGRSISRVEMANLIREIATAIEAGLTIMQALRTVRKQARGKGMTAILDHLINRVEAGAPLYVAAREYGPPFDDLIVGMLRAADASGRTADVLHQLSDLLDRSVELRREVVGAVFYPMILAVLLAGSVIVLITVLVPRLIKPLAQEMSSLPWPTQVLVDLASFIDSYWLFILIGGVVAWIGARMWLRMPENRLTIDRFKLKLPLVGKLLRDVAVARFTRTLGTLASAGLPILDALRITRGTLSNHALMHAIDEVTDKVTAGKALADPLERTGLFPPLLVQVVNLGERSGQLETMLLHAANAFDRQVNNSVKLFTKSLQPFLVIIAAAVAGFVLMAILLPLLDLQSRIG